MSDPMHWQIHTERNYRLGSVTGYTSQIPSQDWVRVTQQLGEVWTKLCDAMIHHHGQYPPDEWQAMLCMVRPDGGNIHICPIRMPWTAHTHRTWVMVHLPLLESVWFDLPDTETDLVSFEAEHDKLMQKIFNALVDSASSVHASAALMQLAAAHPFITYGIHYDDRETMFDMNVPAR